MPKSQHPKPPARASNLEDVVAEKQPVLHPEESVQQAGDKMRKLDTGSLPVAEGRQLVGVVDQRDPDRRAAGFGHDPNTTSVSQIMETSVVFCFEDEDCGEALCKMNESVVDRLPVVDRDMRIVGVVTRVDLTDGRAGDAPLPTR